jgi:hypothetical protein
MAGSASTCVLLPIACLWVVACGARTELDVALASGIPSASSDASDTDAPTDAAMPDVAPPPVACTPAPPTGSLVATLPGANTFLSIGVFGSTLVTGTTVDLPAGQWVGTLSQFALGGGTLPPLVAPDYMGGNFTSDGARLYYAKVTDYPAGVNTWQLSAGTLASVDLATGAAADVPTLDDVWYGYYWDLDPAPPYYSNDFGYVALAATPARPGVFWIGSLAMGTSESMSLSAWDPQSPASTQLATGEYLAGLAVDPTGIYWAVTGNASPTMTVYGASLGGGALSILATVPQTVPWAAVLGVSSDDVVFARDLTAGSVSVEAVSSIEAVSKSGGPVRHVLTTQFDRIWVDDGYVYWQPDAHPGTLNRVAIAGGAPEAFWVQEPLPGEVVSVAFDACNVYIGLLSPEAGDSTSLPAQVFARSK